MALCGCVDPPDGGVVAPVGASADVALVSRGTAEPAGGALVAASSGFLDQHLTFDLPSGTNPSDYAIVARDTVDLADRVSLVMPSSGFAKLVSSGGGTTVLGVESHAGNVISTGGVFLRERAHIHGLLTTAATVQKQNGTVVDAGIHEHAALAYKPFDLVAAFPDTAAPAITIPPDRPSNPPIAPGYYAGLTVFSRSTITLSSGAYFFDSVDIEPQATVRLDDAAGPIFVYVRQTLIMNGGTLQRTQAGHPRLLLGYLGTAPVSIGVPLRGTLLAPSAQVTLNTVGATGHEGAVFARSVQVNPDVRLVHRPFPFLIGNVTVDKATPCAGDTVTVAVQATNPADPDTPPVVTINAAPGTHRLVQMPAKSSGRRAINVAAGAAGLTESQLVFVDVQPCTTSAPHPDIRFESNTYHEHVVEFGVDNAAAFADPSTVYHWDFGDGITAETPFVAISHSYADAISPDQEFTAFDARVTVRRLGQPDAGGAATVTLWNAYAYNKARGRIRPPVETTSQALSVNGQGEFTLSNVEGEALHFTARRIDRQPCDANAAPSYGTTEGIDVTVPAQTTTGFPVDVTGDLTGTCSVAVHLFGSSTSTGKPASADAYLLVPGANVVALPEGAQRVLRYVADQGLAANPNRITDEEVTRLARQGRIPVGMLTGIGAPPPPVHTLSAPGDPPGDAVDQPCTPGAAPPRTGLTCQRTGWTKEAVPQVANGLRGDVILSRACGFVGGILARVQPPQKWSHTGIMVENYVRIRQSTGLEAYIKDHPNGVFDEPTDGFEEQALKYVWPGTFDSEIRQAYETGLDASDPDGKVRNVKGFNHRAIRCEEDGVLVFPHVLRPAAERDPIVRPTLFQIADATDQFTGVKGHYRFFGYTDGTVANNPSAPAWVQDKPTPTVCSLFLWKAAKSINLTLDADKTNNVGVEVIVPTTPDGLFFYREDERRSAAEFLYRTVYNTVDHEAVQGADQLGKDIANGIDGGAGKALGYVIGLGLGTVIGWASDIRDDVANQMVNCFASDDCSEDAKDSDKWKSPGDGQAVSPDDLLSWDLFDQHIEPLVYRTGENAAIYTWQPSTGTGTVCGRVLRDGNPVAGARVVNTDNPLPAISQADGSFRFVGTNAGTIDLTATLFAGTAPDGELLRGQVLGLAVVPGDNPCVDIELQRPSIDFRRVLLDGSLFVHDEGDQNASQASATELFVGLGLPPDSHGLFNRCAGGETRIEVGVNATYLGNGAVTVSVAMDMFEGSCFLCDACDNDDHDGSVSTQILLCDDSSTVEACQTLAIQLGIARFAVKEFNLNGFRVDNTDEDSGEFGRIDSLRITNFRQ
jgi:hypothetical protein